MLTHHDVSTAYERGWSQLKNGELLEHAEQAGFEMLITTDSNLRYQQNLATRRLAIVVLSTTSWPRIQRAIGMVLPVIDSTTSPDYVEVTIP